MIVSESLERLSFFDVAVVILAEDRVNRIVPRLIGTRIPTICSVSQKLKDASFLVFSELNSVQSVTHLHRR